VDLTAFAGDVGTEGPVTCVGGRTAWDVGGAVDRAAREVSAPAGIVAVEPEEMTVRCGAGTTVAELQAALATAGQSVNLPTDDAGAATVGGVLAVGRSGFLRLGHGPLRDCVLQARVVGADGQVVKAGGPTVKNVSGYDLCRLLVGSLGTLAFLGEVILRTRPLPAVRRWFAGEVDPFAVRAQLYRPAAILWDGTAAWVCLEGHPADVAAQAALVPGLAEVDGPPFVPEGGRLSLAPTALAELALRGGLASLAGPDGRFLAEVGVGIVHLDEPPAPREVDAATDQLHQRLKAAFDPTGRLNPGRSPLAGTVVAP
jgi:glycolate oxidase FAD binding subunit